MVSLLLSCFLTNTPHSHHREPSIDYPSHTHARTTVHHLPRHALRVLAQQPRRRACHVLQRLLLRTALLRQERLLHLLTFTSRLHTYQKLGDATRRQSVDGRGTQHIHSNALLALGIITLTLCHKRAGELDGCGLQRGFCNGHYAIMRDISLTSDKGQRENGCLTRKERLQGASQRNEGIGGNGHCSAKVRIRHIHNGVLYRNMWKGASNMQGSRWRVGDGMEYGIHSVVLVRFHFIPNNDTLPTNDSSPFKSSSLVTSQQYSRTLF